MKKMINDRNQTKRVLPETISDSFRTLAVEMRKMPRLITKNGEDTMMVYDGLATVVNPGESAYLDEGMMFRLCRRIISAKKIDVKSTKHHGSNNHHKYLVIVHDGVIVGGAA
jgi:hypothetical protein